MGDSSPRPLQPLHVILLLPVLVLGLVVLAAVVLVLVLVVERSEQVNAEKVARKHRANGADQMRMPAEGTVLVKEKEKR